MKKSISNFTPGQSVILEGKSNKGRSLVQEFGSNWRILAVQSTVMALNGSPGIMVVPNKLGVNDKRRWISLNDQDFLIK